jgi:hypothetical protein
LLICERRREKGKIFRGEMKAREETYKNVPAENKSSIPVHHCPLSPSICAPPSILSNNHVESAPHGAAKLNTIRCPLAALLLNPCFNNTLVNPNAAGALCTIIAIKIINPSLVLLLDAEAPIAIPSAAACITSPVVVARERVCLGEGASDERKDSDSSSPWGEEEPKS